MATDPHLEHDTALVRRYYGLFNERRLTEAAHLVAEDCAFEHVPTRERADGPRGYLAIAQSWLQSVPDAHATVERIEPLGHRRYRVTLVGRGHWDGTFETRLRAQLEPDGKPFEFRATQDLEIRDGLIVSAILSYDVADLLR